MGPITSLPAQTFLILSAQILFHIPVNNGNRFNHKSAATKASAKTIDWL
jgi:hypothetical protein